MTDRIPGELPSDPFALPRDHGACDACGDVTLLAPGSDLCPACEATSRAVAEAAAAARARPAPATLCVTSGRRLTDPQLVLLRGQRDRAGGRVQCLACGRELVLIQGPWLRAVAPSHPAAGGSR